jgi:16S rRNA (adenine1518-N6/adenine1519-N6)-dimethyltransferase
MSDGHDQADEGRDSFATYKELLREYGFHPSRRLGQNFLLDASLHRVLVDTVRPTLDDLVIEVGPGLGFLTRELAGRCRVLAVEVDNRLVQILGRELRGLPDGGSSVRLVHADVLRRSKLNPDVLDILAEERAALPSHGRTLMVANLPYSIAGPLIGELILLDEPISEMVLLLQLEMAKRLTATHDNRDYGALTVQLQSSYDTTFLRRVGSQVFRPRPLVDSAIVHIQARTDGCLSRTGEERRALSGFLRQVFSSRRKKLRNAKVLAGVDLAGSELAPLLELRPDAIEVSALVELFDEVRKGSS